MSEDGGSHDTSVGENAVFDSREPLSIVGDDGDMLRQIILVYLEDGPRLIREISAAFDQNDVSTAGIKAHSLKGASAYAGAVRVHALARAVEYRVKDGLIDQARELAADLPAEYDRFYRVLQQFDDGPIPAGCFSDASRAGAVLPGRDPAVPKADPLLAVFDVDLPLNTMGGDIYMVRHVVHAFLADAPRLIESLSQQLAAGRLDEALRFAHSLRGASGYAGAGILQAHLEALEKAAGTRQLDRAVELANGLESMFQDYARVVKEYPWPD